MSSEDFAKSDHYRNFEDVVWTGSIASRKYEDGIHWGKVARNRASGAATTDWLPMREDRASSTASTNNPFDDGEQVLVCCPSGEMDNGIIVCAIPQVGKPAANPNPDLLTLLNSGAGLIQYDRQSGELTIRATALKIIAPITQSGGDITSDGISAQHHLHGGVRSGAGTTGEPNR